MRSARLPVLLVALALAGVAGPRAAAEEPYAGLLAKKADLVVAVKFVLSVTLNFRGQTQDQEQTGSVIGVLVDKSGLVMIPNSAISAPPRMGRGMDIKLSPSEFRVVFPGDTKEYPALLGASDSKLGLAFVRIKDLEGRTIPALGGEEAGEPAIGEVLYGVSRLGEGFDYAPYVADLRISGKVAKPREMWNLEGSFGAPGHPLFTAAGAIAGVLVPQQGVGESGAGLFLLPWKIASGTIQRAVKAAEEALAEAKAKEAAEAPAGEEKPADKPADPPAEEPAEKPADKPADAPGDKPADSR